MIQGDELMLLRFNCAGCKKDRWIVDHESESKKHIMTCANCGLSVVLEEVFKRGGKKNARPVQKKEAEI